MCAVLCLACSVLNEAECFFFSLHYENLWLFHRSLDNRSDAFLGELSVPLQLDIKITLYRRMVMRMTFLRAAPMAVIEFVDRDGELRVPKPPR